MFHFFSRNIRLSDVLAGFYDVHSHLLPGVDDGSPDSDTSFRLLDRFVQLGVEGVYATPHIICGMYDNQTEESLRTVFGAFPWQGKIGRFGLAAEYFVDERFLEHVTSGPLVFAGKHLLVEYPMQAFSLPSMAQLFEATVYGYQVIVAHPERYLFIQHDRNGNALNELLNNACLQLNLLSLAGFHGSAARKCAETLLRDGRYTFVGTDTHSDRYIDVLCDTKIASDLIPLIERLKENNRTLFEME